MKFIALMLCFWLGASVVGAQVQEFESKRAQGFALRLEGLQAHSQWLLAQKLLGTRLEILAMIIEVDPGNSSARRSLGYKRDRKGGWVAPKRPKRSSDKNPRGLKLEPGLRRKHLEPFLSFHLALIKEAGEDIKQRRALAKDILVVRPQYAEMHELLGEVAAGEIWLPRETLLARGRRLEMQACLAKAEEMSMESSDVNPAELAHGVQWQTVLQVPWGRLRGTVSVGELELCARSCNGLLALYRLLLNPDQKAPRGFGVYLMRNQVEGQSFLRDLADIEPDEPQVWLPRRGLWMGLSNEIAHWAEAQEERLDAVIRLYAQHLLGAGIGAEASKPWLREGFGMFLAYQVTGTRMTWFLPCEDGPGWTGKSALRGRMLEEDDWLLLAAQNLEHRGRPRIEELLLADEQSFSSAHFLYAYSLAALLMEAYPEELQLVLEELRDRVEVEPAMKRRLRMSLDELDLRMQVWLRQYALDKEAARPSKKKRRK